MSTLGITQPASGVPRVPFLRRCRLRGPGGELVGVVLNVSVGGAYVTTEPVPKVGDQIRLFLELPWEVQPMVIDAVVCWDNSIGRARRLPPGCGVEFLAPKLDDRSRIEAMVRDFRSRG